MSSINNMITAIPSAGYSHHLRAQINPRQSFSDVLDLGVSRPLYACDAPALRDPNTSSFHSQSGLQSMLENERLACSESDASMVMQLKHEISELQHAITRLQADRAMLVSENTTLSTKCETLQNVIINIRGSASSVASNSSETSNHTKDERKPCLLDTTTDEECDRELDPEDYPHLKSWTKQQWQEDCPKNSSAVPGSAAKSSRGSARMAQGINVSCTYLQDEQGNPVSAQRAKAIRQLMLSSFRQLETQGLAPDSIGQASLQVLRWLTHTLRKQFLELRLCADNWKSMKLMTDNYSQWYNYHVKRRGTKRIKSEDIPLAGGELRESSVDTLPSTSTSASDPESSSDYLDPMIDPVLQEPPTKKQRLDSLEDADIQISLPPVKIDESAPVLSVSSANKQTETLNVEIKNPL
ncbi:hypothetical protein C8R48DRAFT_408887 [Suillus tomentosus]|nr:hypothetical protein C8R48DRAFT_408887 [Suillus tomentosus]